MYAQTSREILTHSVLPGLGTKLSLSIAKYLYPTRTFFVTVLNRELRELFLFQLPGDFEHIFSLFTHPGFLESLFMEEKKKQKVHCENSCYKN